MTWGAVAAAGATIIGGVIANKGSKDAVDASTAGSQAAIDEQRRQFDTIMGLNQPAINTGNAARSQLAALLGLDVPNTPYGTPSVSSTPYTGGTPRSSSNPFTSAEGIGGSLVGAAVGMPVVGQLLGGRLFGGGSDHSPPNPLTNIDFKNYDMSKIPMPVNDGYWRDKTPEEWKSYLAGIAQNPGHVIDGAPRINAHLRDYVAKNAQQYATPIAQPGQPGAPGQPGQTQGPMSADDVMKRLESLPGYQFAVNQAKEGATSIGSATGSLGGNVVTALGDRIAGGIAGPTFENYLNRLAGLSGAAQTATGNVGQAAYGTGQGVSQNLAGMGDTRASGIIGQTNSIGGILNGLGGAFATYQNGRKTTQPVGNAAPWANPTGNGGLNYLFGDGGYP